MTEEDTFRHLRRISYKELHHRLSHTGDPGLSAVFDSSGWTAREYLEKFYDKETTPLIGVNMSKSEFVDKWLKRWRL